MHRKVWYWAQPGAAKFQLYNVHGSQVFMDRQIDEEDWKYPGELPGISIYNGINPNAPEGKAGCQIGLDDWFVHGVPPGITRDDVIIPECCVPPAFPFVEAADFINWGGGPTLTWRDEVDQPLLIFAATGFAAAGYVPGPPSGCTTLHSGLLPGRDDIYYIVFYYRLPEGGAHALTWTNLTFADVYIFGIQDSAVGPYGVLQATSTTGSITLPSTVATSAHNLLVASIHASVSLITATDTYSGMTGFIALDNPFVWMNWQDDVPTGPTGDRLLSFTGGVFRASVGVAILIR